MKHLLLLLLFMLCLYSSDEITNETSKAMLCNINYQAKYELEVIHGIKQRVQTQQEKSNIVILQPGESIVGKKNGKIKCYNELKSFFLNKNLEGTEVESKRFERFKKSHEVFDITSYINEDKKFIEAKYGISNQCKKYKDGEYCKRVNGLDIFYNKNERVKKIFLYGYPLFEKKVNLPFEIDSFNKIRVNNEPLGLWISKKNSKLIKSKPTFQSSNAIIWENPANGIAKIVMTPKNGYININRYSRMNMGEEKLQDFLQSIEIEFIIDDKAYASHQKSRPTPKTTFNTMNNNYQKKNIPYKAKNTWGKNLNPKNKIPSNKFKAFYINTNEPKRVISSEEVNKVSINYPYNKFHGISSKDFGGYWVGNFSYDKEKTMDISISQSWSKTRIIVDGMVIYEGGNNKTIPYTFSKGKHKIEVEYVNNWHTTNFMISIQQQNKLYSIKELKKELKNTMSKKSDILFVGAYTSDNKDQSITLKIAKMKNPVVLILNSYDSVDWIIKNPHKVVIEAIIYHAYKPGVDIKGDITELTSIYASKDALGSYKMQQKCSCINGGASFHCDGVNALDTINKIENFTGKKVFGFSTKYSASILMVPNTQLTDDRREQFKNDIENIKIQRQECKSKADPDFENMFNEKTVFSKKKKLFIDQLKSESFYIKNNILYLADGNLKIVDLINLKEPILLSELKLPGKTTSIRVLDNIAYVSQAAPNFSEESGGWVSIIDIKNPEKPKILKTLKFGNNIFNIAVNNEYLYVTDTYFSNKNKRELFIYNISTPNKPKLISKMKLKYYSRFMTFSNNLLFLSTFKRKIIVIDVKNPKKPKEVLQNFKFDRKVLAIKTYNNKIVVNQDGNFVSILNVTKNQHVTQLCKIKTATSNGWSSISDSAITIKNNVLYRAEYKDGISVIDINKCKLKETIPLDNISVFSVGVVDNTIIAMNKDKTILYDLAINR